MNEFSACVRFKELVQIPAKRFLFAVAVKVCALFYLLPDDIRHFVREQIELRQIFVRVFFLRCRAPTPFCLLFVGIRPIKYRLRRELIVCKRLKWRSRKVKRIFALDMVERNVRFICINALVRFVDN